MLYDGSVIAKETNVISIADSEETLMLEEESRSKMLFKNNFPVTNFNLFTNHIASRLVKTEAPMELPKSVEITDLNAQLQEKVFVITTLKNDLRKFKGKDIVDNAAQVSNATTIAPGMYKLDLIVKQAISLNPLDSASYFASSSSSDSEVDSCSKSCVKAYATLKEQYDSLSSDYKKSQFNLVSYKAGLGYDAATAASPAVESFVNLIDKSGSDKGYQLVPPPLSGNFIPRKPDLTFIDEIVESENLDVTIVVIPYNDKTAENKGVSNIVESNAVRMNNTSAPIIEDWNFDDESEIDYTIRTSTKKIKYVMTVRETDAPKQNKHHPRGKQRNWNNLMS
ncbi:hypothetical protein Tco_0010083 [Tanacetum coccineum]